MSIVFNIFFELRGSFLKEKIVAKIKSTENNMITYADYMSLALYDPEIGYYMKTNKKLGTEGDFYTSSGVHSVFGQVFAHFFLDVIEKEGLPPIICEFGGGDGRFAKAVMDEWERLKPEGKEDLSYVIIEMSPYHREEQKKLLANNEGFRQYDSLNSLKQQMGEEFKGIIFSNELIDAFPVHVVEKCRDDLYEIYVTVDESDGLTEKYQLCTDERILSWLCSYGPTLKEGQRIEVPLYMNQWITEINEFMNKGLLLTIDYGYTKEQWQMPERKDGSLRGYFKHQLINNPLLHPTEMDITSHIHIDAYNEITEENNFNKVIDLKQNRFLLMIGILKFLQEYHDPNPFSEKSKLNRAIQTLINDSGMSAAFHVFVHSKQLTETDHYRFLSEDPYKM